MKPDARPLILPATLLLCFAWLGACAGESAASAGVTGENAATAPAAPESAVAEDSDVIAWVEDQPISFSQLNTMINSSAMVGLSIPALGTRERNLTVITLLDKVISANLLYLDARDKGKERLPEYRHDLQRYEDAIIASLYRDKVMIGEIPVSDAEIDAYYNAEIGKDTELTDDLRLAIESKLRDQKLQVSRDSLRERLRDGVSIKIDTEKLKAANTNERKDGDVIVRIDDGVLTWGDIKLAMHGADYKEKVDPFNYDSDKERRDRLESLIDAYLLVSRGRAAGLENDPDFIRRTKEYRKTRLINLYRKQLVEGWQPTDEQLQTYFDEHRDEISVPESRKVQMVVVKTEEEARDIKGKIDRGEITMYQAARDYSIVPDAKQNLGVIGWVSRGSGFRDLDEFTFLLEPEELGGPVQSPAGWHLVKVLDVHDAQLQYLSEPQTRKETLRRYIGEKQDEYVVALREKKYQVSVDDEKLHRLFQEQADWIASLAEKAKQEDSVTQERLKDMEKWITP